VTLNPTPPQRIVTRSDAMAGGMTGDQIRQRVRSGLWTALDRATYLIHADVPDDPFVAARRGHAVDASQRYVVIRDRPLDSARAPSLEGFRW
jgi:hypothetical protein